MQVKFQVKSVFTVDRLVKSIVLAKDLTLNNQNFKNVHFVFIGRTFGNERRQSTTYVLQNNIYILVHFI